MAHFILQDCKLYLAQYNLTGYTNEMSVTASAEEVDNTVFGATTRSRAAGLMDVEASASGFLEADATSAATFKIDDILNQKHLVTNQPLTYCPTTGAQGEKAFSFLAAVGEVNRGGTVGEMYKFDMSAYCTGGQLVRMTVMETGAKTATGNGTGQQLGAVSATQKMYAVLHVIAASGTTPSITVKVQSDDNSGFSSPTDRFTFTAATGLTSEWATPVNGAITDDYWRLVWTVSGTTPSLTIVGAVGIQ
jgi:hypothetical protein